MATRTKEDVEELRQRIETHRTEAEKAGERVDEHLEQVEKSVRSLRRIAKKYG